MKAVLPLLWLSALLMLVCTSLFANGFDAMLLQSRRSVAASATTIAFSHPLHQDHVGKVATISRIHTSSHFPLFQNNHRQISFLPMKMETEDSNETTEETIKPVVLQRRRRRRKQEQQPQQTQSSDVAAIQTTTKEGDEIDMDYDDDDFSDSVEDRVVAASSKAPRPPDLKPRENESVALEVKDVRAVVGWTVPTTDKQLDESDRQNRPFPFFNTQTTSPATTTGASSRSLDNDNNSNNLNSLERILADAKQMKLDEQNENDDDGDDESDQNGVNLPQTVGKVLSTLVTIDFFVVCAFLVWFLAGVFASSVLGSDDIQIAFNKLFEPVVQPALGVLMIGSLASAVFKDPEQEEEL